MNYKMAYKVWERLESEIKNNINKLRNQYKFYTVPMDEILSEVQFKFFELYYDVYETDKQFLNYMYIVTKNVIHDLQRREYKFANRHSCDLTKLRAKFHISINHVSESESYVRITNEMAVDNKFEHDLLKQTIYEELVAKVEAILKNPIYIKIFRLILQNYKPIDISEIVNISCGYVGHIKRKHIFPAVKEVLNIPDEEYEWLACSGRIFSNYKETV